jgi:NADP-dependent 3-hydroxy acid dehydrogenase YdfG
LITGASSGIGEATAKIFASKQWNVVLTARRKEKLEKLASMLSQEFQVNTHVLAFDISKRNETEKALSILLEKNINIDVLVNNAGLALGMKPLHEGLPEGWDKMIDVNIR